MSTNYNRPTSKNNTSGNDRRIGKGSNSLHPLRKTSRSDEFFTDSIMSDGSKIPTPSPTKTENIPPSVKPRRAIGNSKNLKAAWDATANRERQFSHPSESATMRHIKPQQQAPARRSNPTPDLPEIKTRNSTPSPSRRAYGPGLTSPESTVSSPPKGLTEAYKRIADEEDLADQEGAFSDEAEFEQDMLPYDADKARSDRIRKSHSPVSIRSQRRNSPRPNGHGMPPPENKENVLQDETEMSKASDLSFINQLTDQELAAKLTPHALDRARDKARLQRAVQRDSPIAFSRAALGSKGHSADDVLLHESEEEADFTRSSNTSTGSGRSDRLDVSLNVPRNWGSKGRAGKEWLNRIHRKDKSAMEDSSAVDWTEAAADVPLPQNGDAALTQPDALRSSTPLSVNHKSSLDKLRQWELNDFTGTSLQISNSPPVRPRNPALGQIRDLEIENLERRAVTTNRLDELRKRESTEKLTRKISPSDRPKPEEPKSAKSVKFEDHGEAIPNTPIVIYKQGANGLPRSVSDNFGEKRSQTERTRDPREDLQRLARAISESPKGDPAEDISIALKDLIWRRGADDDDESRNIEQVKATPLPSRLSALDLATKTPVVTGAWVDTILPDTIKTTKQTTSDEKQLKTPHVLGGWVDTPLPSNKKVSESNEFPEDLMNGIGKVDVETKAETALVPTPNQTKLPQGPRSALAVLLAKAREKKTADAQDGQPLSLLDEKSIDLGDMTIESLEDLLTLDNADMTTLIRMSAELDARRALSANGTNVSSEAEEQVLDRLTGKLERLQNSIYSTRRGISKLERQVSIDDDRRLGPANGTEDDYLSPCETCGCTRGGQPHPNTTTISITLPFYLPLPSYLRLFHPRSKKQFTSNPRNPLYYIPRPTTLGWIVVTLWSYYILESLLCLQYCHPFYAESYTWPEEREPRYGVVIPTMFWRKSGLRYLFRLMGGPTIGISGPLGVVWTLVVAFVRFFGRLFGVWDGFVSEGSPVSMDTGTSTSATTGVPGSEDAGSMAFDDYL